MCRWALVALDGAFLGFQAAVASTVTARDSLCFACGDSFEALLWFFAIPAMGAGFLCGAASVAAESRRKATAFATLRIAFILSPVWVLPELYLVGTHAFCWLFPSTALFYATALRMSPLSLR